MSQICLKHVSKMLKFDVKIGKRCREKILLEVSLEDLAHDLTCAKRAIMVVKQRPLIGATKGMCLSTQAQRASLYQWDAFV